MIAALLALRSLIPWRLVASMVAIIVGLGLIWFAGNLHGMNAVQAEWDKEKLTQAQTT